MLDALNITEAEAAGLAELAALDLAMARSFAARAQAAEDPQVANDCGRSYQRAARSYRQTLALKVRLQREVARAAAEAPTPAPAPPPPRPHVPRDCARINTRLGQVRGALHRVIWAEHEPAEPLEWEEDDVAGYHFERLDHHLDRLAEDNACGLDQPLDEHILQVCRALRLCEAFAAKWRDLPDPPPEAYIDWDDVPNRNPRRRSG